MRRIVLGLLALAAACTPGAEWVDIGRGIERVQTGKAEDVARVPHRLRDSFIDGKVSVAKNTDLVELVLSAQRGRGIGDDILVSVTKCYAPQVRNGLPSVLCEALGGGRLIVVAGDADRGKLLRLKENQVGDFLGRILGVMHSDSLAVRVQ
jgi:hypothetical protein